MIKLYNKEGYKAMADNDKKIIVCPACGCEMEKVFIPEAGVNLDVCVNGCGGIYFDNTEFKKFDEPHEDISPLKKILENKTFKEVDTKLTRYCPVCGSAMMKNYSGVSQEVEVDECYCCGGKFLDHGELEKIRSLNSAENALFGDMVKTLYDNVGLELEKEKNRQNNFSNRFNTIARIIFAGLIILTIYLIVIKNFH